MDSMTVSILSQRALNTELGRVASDKQRPLLFARLMAILIVMNGIDGLLTVFWVSTSQAVEANPLMALLLDIHPALFMALKCALVSFGAIVLWRHRKHTLAMFSLATVCAVYGMVLTHHWRMILVLLG
jgi:hypothetical protein